MHRRPSLRVIAIVLLAWIAVDLVAIDTCVLDVNVEADGGPGGRVTFRAPGSSHLPTAVHPDNCLCHGHTIAPGTPAGLTAPAILESAVVTAAAARPHDISSALYHPPQLGA